MRWEIDTLGNYSKVISGYAFKSDSFRTDNGIPIIKIKNIQREYVEIDGEYFVDTSYLSLDPKFHCTKNDILISLTGSHITLPNSVVGRVAKYHYDFTSLLNQRGGKIVVTNPDKLENNYLYYYLCQNEIRIKLAQFGRGGANQCNISPSNVESIPIILPPLETQKRIASILSAYDDLIENNLKRIKLLEETAQNIYKEWFVNFRFPNYEHTEFDSESGLPVGWEIVALNDIYDKLESGSRPKGGIDKDLKDGIPSIGAESIRELGYFDFSKTKFISNDFFEKMNKGKIEDRDILIYKDGAYIGKTTLFQDDFPYSNCAVNEHVFLLNTKNKLHQYYLFFTLSTKEYYAKMQNLNSNAAQPGINQPKLLQLELLMTNNENLLISFNDKVEPLVKQIYSLAKINKNLKEARDILLPRLMNRTIEV